KMAFRMMRYSIAAMHRHLEADHDKLPLVVPNRFYKGGAHPFPLPSAGFEKFYRRGVAQAPYNAFPPGGNPPTPGGKKKVLYGGTPGGLWVRQGKALPVITSKEPGYRTPCVSNSVSG
ncbi:Rpn family recombination-promoting nuclease/putative transposase, partial [Escherichia coli]|nr:Rpn family recombination-promoting nuclease/putative transposase [Escherichia coli]